MIDYNDGEWHAHKGTDAPDGLNPLTEVETCRIDLSQEYLPLGKSSMHTSVVGTTPWHNPPYNRMITSFRVTKQHKEPITIWAAISSGNYIDSSAVKGELEGLGYTDIRKFVEVTE